MVNRVDTSQYRLSILDEKTRMVSSLEYLQSCERAIGDTNPARPRRLLEGLGSADLGEYMVYHPSREIWNAFAVTNPEGLPRVFVGPDRVEVMAFDWACHGLAYAPLVFCHGRSRDRVSGVHLGDG